MYPERNTHAENIIFDYAINWDESPSIVNFEIDVEAADKLVKEDHIDPDTYAGDGPSFDAIIEYASMRDGQVLGYIVTPERDDSRIDLYGVDIPMPDTKTSVITIINKWQPYEVNTDGDTVRMEWD